MKQKLLPLVLLFFCIAQAQFNANAPWMKELSEKKATQNSRSQTEYTFKEITDAFDAYWEGKDITKKGIGYKPFMRWRNYWQHFVKPDGYLPTGKELWDTYQTHRQYAGPVNPTSNWTSIGPEAPGTQAFGQPGVGRMNAIAVDPNNADIWYAGAPTGGFWKSTDAGDSWTELFQDFPQIGVSGIAIDPNNTNTLYIATGDDDAGDSYSIGVFKSTDAGATWTATGLGPEQTTNFDVFNEIFIDPTNSNVIWVGGTQGILKSEDAGATWAAKFTGNITDFRLKPDDPNTIYAVTGQTRTTGNGNVRYFKSDDGGENFSEIDTNLPTDGGRAVIGVTPAAPDMVYILYSDVFNCDTCYQGLYKSTDSGETFTETANTTDLIERDQAWYDLAIAVSSTDPNEIYTGAINIWKSADGGDSFTRLNNNDNNVGPAYTHVDIHTLKFFNGSLFAGTDGGMYVSSDGGVSFTDKSDGLGVTQFYRMSIAKNNANKIAAGTQDNSGFIYDGAAWNIYTYADGMDYEIDPTNSDVVYGFSQYGGVLFVSSNFGQSVVGQISGPSQGNWITPLAVDANGTVYSAFDEVYRLDGSSWTQVSDGFADGQNIDDLEIDPNNPSVMYIADEGTLYRSDDSGATFRVLNERDANNNIVPFNSQISDIAINTNDGNIVYLTTAGAVGITSDFGQDPNRGVYKITVDGENVAIENITKDLPANEAYFSIVHQPRNANNALYVGTSLGVYRTDDTLTEWEQYSTNLPNIPISDLEISPDDGVLVASSYGRGAWISPIPAELPANDIKLVSLAVSSGSISCDPLTPTLTIENKGANPITQIQVDYTVNNGTEQVFTYSTDLASGALESFDLPTLSTSPGEVIALEATVSITDDAFSDNNTLEANTIIANIQATEQQLFDFESDSSSLSAYDLSGTNPIPGSSVWEVGVPSGVLLNNAGSGTQVIGTNLDGNYPDETTAVIYTGCYDLSTILAPKLSFTMAYDLEQNWDVLYVVYSVDNGETFQVLGELGSQPNWYNSDRTSVSSGGVDCLNCPGAQWTGTNATMTTYSYDFELNASRGETNLTDASNIVFGIFFQSDQLVNQEGVIIDDFVIEGLIDDDDDDDDTIADTNDNCPLIANTDQLDTDSDTIGNACDLDDDNDSIADRDDNCSLVPNSEQEDFDGDGIGDVCDDDRDGDGVPNINDNCDETPLGSVVNVDGCAVFTLPADNFSIQTVGESCIGTNNGSVQITALNTAYNYTATLSGTEEASAQFTDVAVLENLSAGTYTLCLTIESQPDYELCFDVTITEPEPLSVQSTISSLNRQVTLALKGGSEYQVELNGKTYMTSKDEITLPLDKVENVLVVKTDMDCQGSHRETIVMSNQILIFPNPINTDELSIYMGSDEFDKVDISLFTINGEKIIDKPYNPENGYIKMNMTSISNGIYLLNIKTENALINYKILKK